MLPSKALPLVALLLALTAVFAVAATGQAPEKQTSSRSCPEMSAMYVNQIQVQGVGCAQAKRVIVRYTRAIIENLQHDWSVTVLGYSCDLTRKDFYGDSHRCAREGGRVVRFRRGTDGPTG